LSDVIDSRRGELLRGWCGVVEVVAMIDMVCYSARYGLLRGGLEVSRFLYNNCNEIGKGHAYGLNSRICSDCGYTCGEDDDYCKVSGVKLDKKEELKNCPICDEESPFDKLFRHTIYSIGILTVIGPEVDSPMGEFYCSIVASARRYMKGKEGKKC
jgi:hypothetical protein